MANKSNTLNITYLFLNIILYLNIILLNKWIYINVKFPNVTLSMLHFVFAFLGLHTFEKFNIFVIKTVPIGEILPLALTFCGLVVFTNLSLQYNSVETFQITKILTTPVIILIQIFYYGKNYSDKVTATVIPITLGIIINLNFNYSVTILGTIFALLGVSLTCIYQLLLNTKQSELQLNSMQLLYLQAPLCVLFLICFVPFIEPPIETILHNWTPLDLFMIITSCSSALAYNFTTYWIIKNTSQKTYNTISHCKFIFLVVVGSFIFENTMSIYQWVGIGLTLFGIIHYTGMYSALGVGVDWNVYWTFRRNFICHFQD